MIRLISTKRLQQLEQRLAVAEDMVRKQNQVIATLSVDSQSVPAEALPVRDIGAENRKRNAEALVAENQAAMERIRSAPFASFPRSTNINKA